MSIKDQTTDTVDSILMEVDDYLGRTLALADGRALNLLKRLAAATRIVVADLSKAEFIIQEARIACPLCRGKGYWSTDVYKNRPCHCKAGEFISSLMARAEAADKLLAAGERLIANAVPIDDELVVISSASSTAPKQEEPVPAKDEDDEALAGLRELRDHAVADAARRIEWRRATGGSATMEVDKVDQLADQLCDLTLLTLKLAEENDALRRSFLELLEWAYREPSAGGWDGGWQRRVAGMWEKFAARGLGR